MKVSSNCYSMYDWLANWLTMQEVEYTYIVYKKELIHLSYISALHQV